MQRESQLKDTSNSVTCIIYGILKLHVILQVDAFWGREANGNQKAKKELCESLLDTLMRSSSPPSR